MSYIPMGGWSALNRIGAKLVAAVKPPATPAAAPAAPTTPATPAAPAPAPAAGANHTTRNLLIAGGAAVAAYLLFIRGRQ